MKGPLAVFLDRDGVLNELVLDATTGRPESPLLPESVQLVQNAADPLRILQAEGFLLVCVTNQPAAAKGSAPIEQLLSVQARVEELLGEGGVHFDAVRMCLHHPDGVVDGLTGPCACRKPMPGMIVSAASDLGVEMSGSWMIGDTDSDIEAGRAAGCRTILVETVGSAHKRGTHQASDGHVEDLRGAVGIIVPTRENG